MLYLLGVDRSPARVALAEAARDTALRLDPDRGEPHLAAAGVAFHCDLDYETALKEVHIARRELPNDVSVFEMTAFIARRQGHWEQCTRNLDHAVELDPRGVLLIQDDAQNFQGAALLRSGGCLRSRPKGRTRDPTFPAPARRSRFRLTRRHPTYARGYSKHYSRRSKCIVCDC